MTAVDIGSLQSLVAWCTFAVAFVVGAVMNRTSFCTMGAISDVLNMGDWTRLRMWFGAVGVAILATQGMAAAGVIDLGKALYTTANFTWLSYLVGGFLFGVGMVLASGCGSKTLIRIGGGSLKSLVVFCMLGLFAYMTLRGVFGVARVDVLDKVAITLPRGQDLPRLLGGGDAALVRTLRVALGGVIGVALLGWAFADRGMRRLDGVLGVFVVGLAVAAVWYISGHLGYVAEDPNTLEEKFVATNSGRMESLSFVAPVAYTLELLMFWSDKSRIVTVGIAAALGLIAGSHAWSLLKGEFRWEGFRDAEDTANHIVGGALMGVGGVTALGCTIGQGLSGVSTLAVGSVLALAAIFAGAITAMRYQVWRIEQMA